MQTTSKKRPPFMHAGSKAIDADPLTLAEGLLTAYEVARILQISRSMVYQLLRRGDLPSVQFGRMRRFRREDLRGYVRRHSGPIRRRA